MLHLEASSAADGVSAAWEEAAGHHADRGPQGKLSMAVVCSPRLSGLCFCCHFNLSLRCCCSFTTVSWFVAVLERPEVFYNSVKEVE